MEDLAAGNSTEVVTGNPSSDPSATSNGTGNQNGEARQSATVQDSFLPQGVDINTLPPNVRAHVEKINADMVRGFTEKTTKLSETTKSEVAKAVEAYKQKAESYDQIAAQEEFVKQWNAYVQETQKAPQGAEAAGDPALIEMKQQLQQMSEKIQHSELEKLTDGFAGAVNEKGEKLHPEFEKLNNIMVGQLKNGNGVEDYSLLRIGIELSQETDPGKRLVDGYKRAETLYKSIYEEGRKAGMGRLQAKVLNGTNPPSNSSGDVLTVTEKKPRNAHEAMALARKGIVVSRD